MVRGGAGGVNGAGLQVEGGEWVWAA